MKSSSVMSYRRVCLTLAALLMSSGAMAESTTGTTLTIDGVPRPGGKVTMHVVVTGSHIVFAGPGTVYGGNVDLYMDGSILARIQVNITNTNQTKVDRCAAMTSDYVCLADRVYGDRTEFGYPVTLSATPGRHSFSARFTGDDRSHSSDSQLVNITASGDVNAAIDLLLND